MNMRCSLSVVFLLCLILTCLSCSKTDTKNNNGVTSNPVFGNSFNYTVTDTAGVQHIFSDTTILLINSATGDTAFSINGNIQSRTAAYIEQSNTTTDHTIKFSFNDIRTSHLTELNQLTLYLPYYQNNITINHGIGNAQFILLLNHEPSNEYAYLLNLSYFQPDFTNIYINKGTISTNVTDSTSEYISGTFDISATTQADHPILITGAFSHVSGNFHN